MTTHNHRSINTCTNGPEADKATYSTYTTNQKHPCIFVPPEAGRRTNHVVVVIIKYMSNIVAKKDPLIHQAKILVT
jgi:hypothetical protein